MADFRDAERGSGRLKQALETGALGLTAAIRALELDVLVFMA